MDLKQFSKELRLQSLKMAFDCGKNGSHVGPGLSSIEILATLYGDVLHFDVNNPNDENRDRLVVSKGHCVLAYYSALNKVGFLTDEDIASFESYEDKQMFLDELGLEESGVNRLIKKAYSLLNLETFITAGEMEVKAWTYHKGWKAPQCAGVIHSDFEKGFIRAEVIKYDDYIKYGSEAAVRDAGKLSIEGKDYLVQDGDIMHFRFNV